jgi:hypothetical protein
MPGLTFVGGLDTAWGATTTAPVTLGGLYGYWLRQIGQKYYQVMIAVDVTVSSAGSGDYLFTLPSSLTFNTTLNYMNQQPYTGSVGSGSNVYVRYLMPGSGAITDLTSASQLVGASVYDSTRFRVITNNLRAWGSGHYPASNNLRVTFTFQFQSA